MSQQATITVDAAKFADHDDCLQAAAEAYAAGHGVEPWEVSAEWTDDERDSITLTVPATAAA